MPIQPANGGRLQYMQINDVEDVTPIANTNSFTQQLGITRKQLLAWGAAGVALTVVVFLAYWGVRDEAANMIVYQTSLGNIGGLHVMSSGVSCIGGKATGESCAKVVRNSAEVKIDTSLRYQTIIGFGGAFTESAAVNFYKLPEDVRTRMIEAYFGESGIGLTMGRIHINSCDFSLDSYNFDYVPNDYHLEHFDTNVTHDELHVLPFIREAMSVSSRPIRLVASPWSPPPWMKVPLSTQTKGTYAVGMDGSAQPNGLINTDKMKTTWAKYITKFIKAYKEKGVNIWAVTPQNEPEFAAPWEACVYNATTERDFVNEYLGPILKATFPAIKILGFDHNKDHMLTWAHTLLSGKGQYFDGIAFHWYGGGNDRAADGTYGYDAVNATYNLMQGLKSSVWDHSLPEDSCDGSNGNICSKILLATEGCSCPGVRLNDWLRAERLGHDVIYDLLNNAHGWIDWNLLLDATGGPNHVGNVCDASLIATEDFSDLHIQPKFYYFGHISRFITPGSVRVHAGVKGDYNYEEMDPNVQPGLELGMFMCERSVRQTWKLIAVVDDVEVQGGDTEKRLYTIQLATAALSTHSFDTGDVDPVPEESNNFLCASRGDNNRPVLHITNCEESGTDVLQVQMNESNQLVESVSGMCIGLNGDGTEPGVLLALQPCLNSNDMITDEEHLIRQQFHWSERTGEFKSYVTTQVDEELCLTAGWPFLTAAGFISGDTGNTVVVLMNEADAAIGVQFYDSLKKEYSGDTTINARSIQTVLFQ